MLNTAGYTLPRFGWLVELEHGAQGDSSLATREQTYSHTLTHTHTHTQKERKKFTGLRLVVFLWKAIVIAAKLNTRLLVKRLQQLMEIFFQQVSAQTYLNRQSR